MESLDSFHHSPCATNFGYQPSTRIECYANKFSTLIPTKPLGLIVHGLRVNVFAIECNVRNVPS